MLLPEENPYVSGDISLYDTMVRIGEEKSLVTLPLQLHAFLVGCLAEHSHDPEIISQVLALDFLGSTTKLGTQGNVLLRRAGDEALILAGLYPERASRLHVSSSYFHHMGQAAYATLAVKLHSVGKTDSGKFYDRVTDNLSLLEKVLGATRPQTETLEDAFMRFKMNLQ